MPDATPSAAIQKPRVCLVTPYPPAPSETFIRAHAELLPADVALIHSWPPSTNGRHILSRPQRAWQKALEKFASGESPTTAAYLKVFRAHRAAVVLAEYGPTAVLTMRACRLAPVPLVAHFHGFDASVRSVLEENRAAYTELFHLAAALVAVSRAMQRRLIELGAPAERVHYNPCGVDCLKFRGSHPEAAPPTFLAVGRLVEKKAPQLTLRAFAKVHDALPAARLRVIGDGPELAACRTLARELNIETDVTFLGTQPAAVVEEEMRKARCFVQHSIEAASGDSEGTPVGILEAGASGLPVVSTRHGGIPDVIIEAETGFLVAEHDIDSMADRMLQLARDPALAAALGKAGRQRIERHFSMERSIAGLWQILAGCL